MLIIDANTKELEALKVYKASITDPLDVIEEVNDSSAFLKHARHTR